MKALLALSTVLAALASNSCARRDASIEPGVTVAGEKGTPSSGVNGADPSGALAVTSAPPAASSASTPPTAQYPIRWSPSLQLKSLDQLDVRLAAADGLGFGELELGDEQVIPTNCKQWAELHQAGYVPSTSLEVQADGGALLRCEALRALKMAKPAPISFVRELPVPGPALLSILPAAFATAESPERVERLRVLTQQTAPLSAFDAKAKIEKGDPPVLARVREGDGQSVIDLQPMAWGDFDDDGVDDVAMAVRNSMTKGSYSTARLLLVTRRSGESVLRTMPLPTDAPR